MTSRAELWGQIDSLGATARDQRALIAEMADLLRDIANSATCNRGGSQGDNSRDHGECCYPGDEWIERAQALLANVETK